MACLACISTSPPPLAYLACTSTSPKPHTPLACLACTCTRGAHQLHVALGLPYAPFKHGRGLSCPSLTPPLPADLTMSLRQARRATIQPGGWGAGVPPPAAAAAAAAHSLCHASSRSSLHLHSWHHWCPLPPCYWHCHLRRCCRCYCRPRPSRLPLLPLLVLLQPQSISQTLTEAVAAEQQEQHHH